jgi:hypothetical protein
MKSLYGVEESGGVRALVMELVEGLTLAERISGGAELVRRAETPRTREDLCALKRARAAEHSCGKHENRPQNAKRAADGDTDDAEWQQEQPDDRIKEQRQHGQRPADHQQDAPEKEFEHHSLYGIEPAQVARHQLPATAYELPAAATS